MPRVKRSVHARKKRRKVLERAKGYVGQSSISYRKAKEQSRRPTTTRTATASARSASSGGSGSSASTPPQGRRGCRTTSSSPAAGRLRSSSTARRSPTSRSTTRRRSRRSPNGRRPRSRPKHLITSAANPRLKLVRKLGSRRQRDKLGLFACEGGDLVAAGLDAGLEPVEALVDAERPALVERLPGAERVASEVMAGSRRCRTRPGSSPSFAAPTCRET